MDCDWLTKDQLARLTGKRRASLQCRILGDMGVPFAVSAAGLPLVDSAKFFASPAGAVKKKVEPNWSACRGSKAA